MARGKKRTPRPRNEGSVASSSGPTVEQIASLPAEQHGDRAERVRAQQQIAAGRELSPPSRPSPAGPAAAAPQAGGPDVAAELGRLAQTIFADTQRPDEPLTTGAPEMAATQPGDTAAAGQAQAHAAQLPILELRASMPDASPTFRNYVRSLRAQMPFDDPRAV